MTSTGHLGVQFVASLLARSTTQTAIVLGAGLGCEPPAKPDDSEKDAEPRLRTYAANEMLGVLRTALVPAKIVDVGHENRSKAKELRSQFNRWKPTSTSTDDLGIVAKKLRSVDSLKVDMVVTPLDGATALKNGMSGSVSVAAAGQVDCFAKNKDKAGKGYIAIAVPNSSLTPKLNSYLTDLKIDDQQGKTVDELLHDFTHLEKIVNLLRVRGIPPVIAITVKDKADQVKIDTWHRRRVLEGSVVACGLGAYLDKIDCSLMLTRRSQLTQLAIACKGLGGKLVAFPLEKDVVKGDLVRETDLVLKNNALLCVTSISEVCVLDRVRFDDPMGMVKTDTVLVSLVTGRVIRQTDTFILDAANARDPDGLEVKLQERIESLWKPTVPPNPPHSP